MCCFCSGCFGALRGSNCLEVSVFSNLAMRSFHEALITNESKSSSSIMRAITILQFLRFTELPNLLFVWEEVTSFLVFRTLPQTIEWS